MTTYPLTFKLSPHTSPVSGSLPCLPTPNQTTRWSLQMGFILQGPHALTVLPSRWDITLFSADPKPILLSRLCFVWLWCVCIGRQDRLWVPEAGSIAILTSLVPVLCLAQSKQVWTVCRDCIIILLFPLAFFFFEGITNFQSFLFCCFYCCT